MTISALRFPVAAVGAAAIASFAAYSPIDANAAVHRHAAHALHHPAARHALRGGRHYALHHGRHYGLHYGYGGYPYGSPAPGAAVAGGIIGGLLGLGAAAAAGPYDCGYGDYYSCPDYGYGYYGPDYGYYDYGYPGPIYGFGYGGGYGGPYYGYGYRHGGGRFGYNGGAFHGGAGHFGGLGGARSGGLGGGHFGGLGGATSAAWAALTSAGWAAPTSAAWAGILEEWAGTSEEAACISGTDRAAAYRRHSLRPVARSANRMHEAARQVCSGDGLQPPAANCVIEARSSGWRGAPVFRAPRGRCALGLTPLSAAARPHSPGREGETASTESSRPSARCCLD